MSENTSFCDQVRQLIAVDDLPGAITLLRDLLKNSTKLDEAIMQSARLSDIGRRMRLGLVDDSQSNLEKNQIRAGLLALLDEVETQERTIPELRDEISRFASQTTIVQHAEKIYNIDKIDNANFS